MQARVFVIILKHVGRHVTFYAFEKMEGWESPDFANYEVIPTRKWLGSV